MTSSRCIKIERDFEMNRRLVGERSVWVRFKELRSLVMEGKGFGTFVMAKRGFGLVCVKGWRRV